MKTRTFEEFVKALVSELNRGRLPYAITGALAVSYYGTPRTTADIDLIVQVSATNRNRLLGVLEATGLNVQRNRMKRQLDAGYNVITLHDKHSPQQADLIIQTRGRLVRRGGTLLGLKTYYQTPESLILAKLRMIKATLPGERSLKDREDIKAIIRNTKVNRVRIARTARRETTLDIWKTLLTNEPLRKRNSGINPDDPIFRRKPAAGEKGTENASKEVDETLYG